MQSDLTPANSTQPYKSVVAFVVAFGSALITSIQGRTDLNTMGVQQWIVVVLSALVVAGTVYVTPNTPKGV